MWNKDVTIGEMGGNKNSFFSALLVEDYKNILAYTYNGSFYLWRYKSDEKQFKSETVVHGHFGGVSDLDWDSSKSYLVTTSEDQTTRIFANWKKNGMKIYIIFIDTWHEINRPQIHGYDINSICCVNVNKGSDEKYIGRIASGADEKILRVFQPPFNIIHFLQELSEIKLNFSRENENSYYEKCNIFINH